MKKLLIILLFIFVMPFSASYVKAEDTDISQIFKLDVQTLKYEQKQLVYAVITGNATAVRTILNSDPNPNTTYAKIPLTMFAIYSNQNEILKILIEEYSFDPNEKVMDVTPLEIAITLKKYDAVKYLLSIGVEPSEDDILLGRKSKNRKIRELFE